MYDSVAPLHSSALCSLVEMYSVIGKTMPHDRWRSNRVVRLVSQFLSVRLSDIIM